MTACVSPSHYRFTADYTLTQVSDTLRIQTSVGNEFLYPLLAVLPQQLLAACVALQPRPEWERTLASVSVPFWLLVILCVVATVFVQIRFGIKSSSTSSYKEKVDVAKEDSGDETVLDSNNLAKSVEPSLSKRIQELGEKK